MKKPIIEGLIIVLIFFFTLGMARQVDWMALFRVEQGIGIAEQKLGELFWDLFRNSEKEIKDRPVNQAIDSIVSKICKDNDIKRESIKVHILQKAEVNAFALPDGHLVINSGLILASAKPEELGGVIGHEIAHIRLNHVMKKLVKELGMAYLISITTGNAGSEKIGEAAKILSSTAFDRGLEKEADIQAVDYLINSGLDPVPFARFLERLSLEREEKESFAWISTHPGSKKRADYIRQYSQDKTLEYAPLMSQERWDGIREELKDDRFANKP